MTRLENDTESIYELITEVRSTQDDHTLRLGRIEAAQDDHTQRLGRIEDTLDAHSHRFDGIEGTLEEIVRRLPETS